MLFNVINILKCSNAKDNEDNEENKFINHGELLKLDTNQIAEHLNKLPHHSDSNTVENIRKFLFSIDSEDKIKDIIEKMMELDNFYHPGWFQVIMFYISNEDIPKIISIIEKMSIKCASLLFKGSNMAKQDEICDQLSTKKLTEIFKYTIENHIKTYARNNMRVYARNTIREMLFCFMWKTETYNPIYLQKMRSKASDILVGLGVKNILEIIYTGDEYKLKEMLNSSEEKKNLYLQVMKEMHKNIKPSRKQSIRNLIITVICVIFVNLLNVYVYV